MQKDSYQTYVEFCNRVGTPVPTREQFEMGGKTSSINTGYASNMPLQHRADKAARGKKKGA
jgi:hypothetical protein